METIRKHLLEYLMEAAQLGIFMISAGVFTCLFEYSSFLEAIARFKRSPSN